MKAIVKNAHKTNYPNPIAFEKDECLNLLEVDEQNPNWIKVVTSDGNSGWAPVQYILKRNEESKGIATTAYDARELNTKVGEELHVLYELNNWYRVVNTQGATGWVPSESVVIA